MQHTVNIKVTLDDEFDAIAGDPCNCPIARAMDRIGLENPFVTTDYISWSELGLYHFAAEVPKEVSRRIILYDEYRLFSSFEFELTEIQELSL